MILGIAILIIGIFVQNIPTGGTESVSNVVQVIFAIGIITTLIGFLRNREREVLYLTSYRWPTVRIQLRNEDWLEVREYRKEDFIHINRLNAEEKWNNLVENKDRTREA